MKRKNIITFLLSFLITSFMVIGTSFIMTGDFKMIKKHPLITLLSFILNSTPGIVWIPIRLIVPLGQLLNVIWLLVSDIPELFVSSAPKYLYYLNFNAITPLPPLINCIYDFRRSYWHRSIIGQWNS